MSDIPDDVVLHGRQLLNKSKIHPLREEMQNFVAGREASDLKTLRSTVSNGESLSDVVDEDREERL